MSKTIAFSTIAVVALAGVACFGTPEPAAAKDYEYCRHDYVSGTRSCSFDTMEQCLASASGRGGSCGRDPFMTGVRDLYAYAPKGRPHAQRQRAD